MVRGSGAPAAVAEKEDVEEAAAAQAEAEAEQAEEAEEAEVEAEEDEEEEYLAYIGSMAVTERSPVDTLGTHDCPTAQACCRRIKKAGDFFGLRSILCVSRSPCCNCQEQGGRR